MTFFRLKCYRNLYCTSSYTSLHFFKKKFGGYESHTSFHGFLFCLCILLTLMAFHEVKENFLCCFNVCERSAS